MLRSENRLTKNNDFDNVFKNGRSNYSRILGIKVIANNLDNTRFGILVGLKVSRQAVARNKIKRQIRAIIKNELPLCKNGYDLAIIVFPLILAKKYQEIESALHGCFKKLNLYR